MVFVALTALAFSPSLEGGGAPTGPTVKLTNGTVAGTASNGIATRALPRQGMQAQLCGNWHKLVHEENFTQNNKAAQLN